MHECRRLSPAIVAGVYIWPESPAPHTVSPQLGHATLLYCCYTKAILVTLGAILATLGAILVTLGAILATLGALLVTLGAILGAILVTL